MPHYDYRCSNCGHQLEAFQKITDQMLKECPQCKKEALKRGPGGGIGLSFQGSGFYSTDYASHTQSDNPSKKDSIAGSCCPCGKSSSCSSS